MRVHRLNRVLLQPRKTTPILSYSRNFGERGPRMSKRRLAWVRTLRGELEVPQPTPVANDRGRVVRPQTKADPNAQAPAYVPDPDRPYAHPYYWAPFILMGNWL